MKQIARWGLVALIFAVALVFFGSVICPPIGERELETGDSAVQYPLQEDPGTYKALPGELQIEDRFPVARTDPASHSDELSTVEVSVVDDRGLPVPGARIHFMQRLDQGFAERAGGLTNKQGKLTSPSLFEGAYEVRVKHDDFFIAITERFQLPSLSPLKLQVLLSPASYVSGVVQTTAGNIAVHGEILLTDLNSGKSFTAPILPGGIFRSPPLDPGHWSLSWSETIGGTPASNMRFALPLEHKQKREFRITIPSQEPQEDAPYAVGVEPYFK